MKKGKGRKDKLLVFQEALHLDRAAQHEEEGGTDSLTPEEMTKFSRILKLMVWLEMDYEDRVLH